MFKQILLVHTIVVFLFLVHYIVKLLLLLMNKDEQLTKYTAISKVPEMILSAGFLITGVWMLVLGTAAPSMFFYIKLALVFASIPLAVIGFKRRNKVLALLAVFFIVMAYGLAEMNKKKLSKPVEVNTTEITDPMELGKTLYIANCSACHGTDGKQGLSGAKDLSLTTLTIEQQKEVITKGSGAMPGNQYDEKQLEGLIQYLATLKQ